MAELTEQPNRTGPIYVPQWDDVVQLKPRPTISAAERRAFKQWNTELPYAAGMDAGAKRELRERQIDRNPPAVARDVALDLSRSRFIYESMRETELPGWRQKMVRILTALDNIQDDVATAAWLTRPLLARVPGGIIIGDVLQGTASALSRMEKAVIGPAIYMRSAKHRAIKDRQANIRSRKGIVGLMQRGIGWVKNNFGHLLEAAQSSQNHLGVGLALGPIFGALEETQDRALISAWNAGKYLVAQSVAAIPGLNAGIKESLHEQSRGYIENIRKSGTALTAEIPRLIQSAAVLAGGHVGTNINPDTHAENEIRRGSLAYARRAAQSGAATYIMQDNPNFTTGEHALALWAAARNNAFLAHTFTHAARFADLEHVADLPAPRSRVGDNYTRDLITEAGGTFDALGHPLNEWSEPEISVRQAVKRAVKDHKRHAIAWLAGNPQTPAERFMHALAEAYLPTAALQLTGSVAGIRDVWEPPLRAEMMLYELGTYPPQEIKHAELAAWMRDQVKHIKHDPYDYSQRAAARITAHHWPIAPAIHT